MTIPAVVSILDLGTTSVATTGMRFEASYTASGVATTVQVGLDQIMTAGLGALPTGGNTGQVLGKSSATDFAATWVDLALVGAAGLSVLGVSGAATAIPTALVGTATQIFGVNTSTAGFFAATSLMPGPFKTTTLGAFGVVIAQGTSVLQVAAPSTAGSILIDQGAAANPAFRVVGGDMTMSSAGTATIGTNMVSYAKIQQGTGLAVLGFGTTAASNVTTFVASGANQVLAVNAGNTGIIWTTVVSGSQVLLNTLSPNNVATIGDVTSFTTTYKNYLLTLENVVPANTTAIFYVQVATTGSTFAGSGYFSSVYVNSNVAITNDTSAAAIILSGSRATTWVGNGTTYGISGFVRFFNPAGASTRKMVVGELSYLNGTTASHTTIIQTIPSGFFDVANSLSGFQFLFSPGNIQTGTIKVYGLT